MTFLRKTAIALVGLLIGLGLGFSETFRWVMILGMAVACVWALGLFIYLQIVRSNNGATGEKDPPIDFDPYPDASEPGSRVATPPAPAPFSATDPERAGNY